MIEDSGFEEDNGKAEISLKILLIGDSEVGKTCLLQKFVEDSFQEEHIATIGVEYKHKYIVRNNYKIRLKIWDTAGQERFHSITKNIYRNAEGILFVYDITRKQSFVNIKSWIQEIESVETNIKGVILGNKYDLTDEREVQIDELKGYGEKQKMPVIETSAKTNYNVPEAFNLIIDELLKNKSNDEILQLYGKKIRSELSISKKADKQSGKKSDKSSCC